MGAILPNDIQGKACKIHQRECIFYCPECFKFRCILCNDVHYQKDSLHSVYTQINHFSKQIFLLHKSQIINFYANKGKKIITRQFMHFANNIIRHHETVVHYWKENSITIFNPINHSKINFNIQSEINILADSIAYMRRIFILGGNLLDDVYEVDYIFKKLNHKAPMLIAKYSHSLCASTGFLYSIGGNKGCAYTNDCEKYDISLDKWSALPVSVVYRTESAVFCYNDQYIYCCSGTYDRNMVERLNIKALTEWWEAVSVKNPFNERSDLHGIQLNETQAIIFGGYKNNKGLVESYILNLDNDEIECIRASDLVSESVFMSCTAPVKVFGRVYAIDALRRIHVYDNGKWNMII